MSSALRSRTFKVIAIDPGGTTGITMAWMTGEILKVRPFQERMNALWFGNFLKLHRANTDHVICEDFEFRKGARAGLDLTPCHLIGVVMFVFGEDMEKVRFQKASEGKAFYKDDVKIKEMNLWLKGKPHAMDSLRHFLQWYSFGPGFQYPRAKIIQLDVLDD